MKVKECIPEDKHDLSALERARVAGFPVLNEILPELLEWLQDANWPVAQPTASLLAEAGREIAPHINDVLTGEDAVWKYWLIELLVRDLKPAVISELRDELVRLTNQPARHDKLEEVDAAAQRVLVARPS